MDKIYLASIQSGEYEDFREHEIFATFDKEKAENWRDKYNKIIDNNRERIMKFAEEEDYDRPEPFWFHEIAYERPMAIVREVEYRHENVNICVYCKAEEKSAGSDYCGKCIDNGNYIGYK